MHIVTSEATLTPKLFEVIATELSSKGHCIYANALPTELSTALLKSLKQEGEQDFIPAGIGRESKNNQDEQVRRDHISWIDDSTPAGAQWLRWAKQLQQYLNRRLYLGLFSFESHFAHYRPGDFYKRHYDAFKGQANRVLSLVVYLNQDWNEADGGEFVLYQNEQDQLGTKVTPKLGTVAVFLSEEFPHEVLAANRDRYSIAGWFRINTSKHNNIDPPS